ncbi:NAD(P)-binding protein [Apiospora arundinis]|uniref:NAD(P)-binding protein n=1 Tax=Apiospora arundinis TaxID=335852 RepID=A0ABR2ISU5_9PEZI
MISKKTVLITGCSNGGIGSALALLFHRRGYHVFATARDTSKMSELDDLPETTLLTLDVVKPADIKAAVERVTQLTAGKLDFLVNNAGHNHFMPILDEDLEVMRDLFETNFYGPIALTQAFAPLLIESKGMAAYITSISGYVNTPYMGTYAASKRSLEIVAETLRLELAPFGVGVLEVVTGGVKTNGQTYFGDFKLPSDSLYKSQEPLIASRAQGRDNLPRMETLEYAAAVVDEINKCTTGRFWYGSAADWVRSSTTATAVPQADMDAGASMGCGLDALGK